MFSGRLHQKLQGRKTKQLLDARANEDIAFVPVENNDGVWETVDEAAGEFLLLMEPLLHDKTLRDIHQSALVTDHDALLIAGAGARIEAVNERAVFAAQRQRHLVDGAVLFHGLREYKAVGRIGVLLHR